MDNILIVGCGNMGGAILAGWLAGGMARDRITVVDPMCGDVPQGVTLTGEMPQGRFDTILLGVKPQLLADVAATLEPLAGPHSDLVSILAGVELATLAEYFPRAGAHVRLMPNLAAGLGKSPLALAGIGLDPATRSRIEGLLGPLGTIQWIEEGQFDVVTALAGSGPAFVYRFIDSLAKGAQALGMDREQAGRLALATVDGAAALAAASPDSPGTLARKVASPGGTTEAGLKALDADGALERLVEKTLRAACDRSVEMTKESRKS